MESKVVDAKATDSFKGEWLFLVAKLLESRSETSASAALLRRELDSATSLLNPRYDWTGKPHPKTFNEVEAELRKSDPLPLAANRLEDLVFELCAETGRKSLLARTNAKKRISNVSYDSPCTIQG